MLCQVDDSGESAEPVDAQNGEEQVKDAQSKEEGDHRPAGAAVHPGRRDTRRGDRGFKVITWGCEAFYV